MTRFRHILKLVGLGGAMAVGMGLAAAPAYAVDNPTITSVSPNTGSGDGGDSVTIHGSGFYCGTGGPVVQGADNPYNGHDEPPPHDYLNVFFGSNAANIDSTPSDGLMTVTTPSGSGTVDVTVTCVTGNTASSAATPADHFTYISTLGGGGGAHSDPNLGNSSSGPSSLAQTGGGPGARPMAATSWNPWSLALILLVPAAWFTRRLFARK